MARESRFQARLIVELKQMFPGSVVLKNDSSYMQGIPDLIILFNDKWAALECKVSEGSIRQPNQEYYIGTLGKMSYASFIHPDNKEEVLGELQQAFRSRRATRVSRSE